MTRAGRKDRGLLSKSNTAGKVVWFVRLYHDGKERKFGSFTTKTEARDFYEKRKQDQKDDLFFPERYQTRQKAVPLLFKDYVAQWEANYPTTGNKPTTLKTYHHRLQKRILPAFGEQPVVAIKRPQIKTWVAALLREGLDFDTTKGYLLTLSGVLTQAVEDTIIPSIRRSTRANSSSDPKPLRRMTRETLRSLRHRKSRRCCRRERAATRSSIRWC